MFGQKAKQATKVYEAIVAQSRQAVFYQRDGIADTFDGRWDVLILHVAMVFYRLGDAHKRESRLAQGVWNVMMRDMDANLREMGVGDLGVAKRIKAMALAAQGRLRGYQAGLEGDAQALESALARNVYRAQGPER